MISVPEAGLLPSTPRAVACMNGSMTSCGKPCGYVGSACGVTMPIISQCPSVVSLPFERSSSRPATAGAPGIGATPSSGATLPSPSASIAGRSRPPDRPRDVAEGVGALVSELCCVRQGACAHAVEHDDARARHVSILEPWSTVLGLLGVALYIPTIIAIAAGVTWIVVKLSPGTKDAAAKAKS